MYTITQYKKDIPKIREGARRDPGMSNNEVMKLEEDKDLKGETMGGLSTGESGFMGKTLFPDKDGIQNSPNGNIIVIINKIYRQQVQQKIIATKQMDTHYCIF